MYTRFQDTYVVDFANCECSQYVVGGLGSDRILFPRMRGTRIKINELNEESGQNPEI